jgi:ubiquinone/menaquinone biosynthesis C-methylase UbiE
MYSAQVARKLRETEKGSRPYALGYTEAEFRRLERQGGYYRELTEDVLVRAGIGRGMRVLDLGCGVGDVSLLAGRLVGSAGSVVGVDRSPEAIAMAAARVRHVGLEGRVRFAAAELEDYAPEGRFDAVIGRLVLMYLPDPVAALRRFAACLRPGGVLAFQEIATAQARTVPETPLFRQAVGWITATFERCGFDFDMGDHLYGVFLAAGFPAPEMIAAARVEAGPDTFAYAYVAETVRSLLPAGERVGTMSRDEVDVDTLADRLREEALRHSACIVLPTLIGAWARTPG